MGEALGRVARLVVQQVQPVKEGGSSWFSSGYNSITIEGLRMSFASTLTVDGKPNACSVRIYNLAPQTRADLQQLPLVAFLEAGYRLGDVRRIFSGDVRTSRSERSGPTYTLDLEISDGYRAWRGASFQRSYRRNVPAVEVLRDCARACGLALPAGVEAASALRRQLPAGYVGDGGAVQQLERLLAGFGFSMSITDGALEVVPDGGVRPGEALLVSAETGLVGSPKIDPKGVKTGVTFRKVLDPLIYPRSLVKLVSQDVNGLFRVGKVQRKGDTRSGDWYTDCEAKLHG